MRRIVVVSLVAFVLAAVAAQPAWSGWTWDRSDSDSPHWVDE